MPHNKNKRPSEIEDADKLAQNRLEAWDDDYQWRYKHVPYDKYLDFYEGSGDSFDDQQVETDDDGFPRINLTQRSIDDSVYFVLRNLPDARLRASRTHLDSGLDPLERDLRLENIHITEDTMNSLVDTILEDNEYRNLVERAILDAGIYGTGFLFTTIDRSASVLKSKELRGLLEKAKKGVNWTEEDAKRYKQLSQRPDLQYHDARFVTMMAGVRRFDSPRMLRCSTISYFRTESLKRRYSDIEGIGRLESGGLNQYVDAEQDPAVADTDEDYSSLLTTWEIEPFEDTVRIPNTNSMAQFLNARMIKTVVAGNVLVERETWEATDGQIRLPCVPFQFRQSRRHAYGRSEAKSLAQSERLVNRVRSMMYKSGLNSIRPDGVSVFVQNLAPGDQEQLQQSFEEGGPAFITGNMVGNEVSDIREIVMPHTFASSPLDPALRQMMNIEMEAFRFNSAKGSSEAVDQARTGRGKRAQIAFNDRPKNFSVMNITGSIKRLYENLYEIIQTVYSDKNTPVDVSTQQGRQQVKLNEEMTMEGMPVIGEDGTKVRRADLQGEGNSQTGEEMVTRPLEFVLNSTNFDMDARVQNRADLPFDIPSRHQIVRQLQADGYLSPEFARRLVLSDEMRLRDDMHRKDQKRRRAQQMAQQMRQQASVGQGNPLAGQPEGGEGGPQPEGGSGGQTPQDTQDNLRQQIQQNTEE